MLQDQFKTITKDHLLVASRIYDQDNCIGVACKVCPFYNKNISNTMNVACFLERFNGKPLQTEVKEYIDMATEYIKKHGEKLDD